MDVQEISRKHPELVRRLLQHSTGPLGEVLVAMELEKRGYKTEVMGNTKQLDLRATSPVGKSLTLEVKSKKTSSAWWVRTEPERSSYWIFTRLDIEALTISDLWILSLQEIKELWRSKPYNLANPGRGDIPDRFLRDWEQHQWHKLPA